MSGVGLGSGVTGPSRSTKRLNSMTSRASTVKKIHLALSDQFSHSSLRWSDICTRQCQATVKQLISEKIVQGQIYYFILS